MKKSDKLYYVPISKSCSDIITMEAKDRFEHTGPLYYGKCGLFFTSKALISY